MDEEAAEVVREIFRLCVSGYGPTQIAHILTGGKSSALPITHWRKAKSHGLYFRQTSLHGTPRQLQRFWKERIIWDIR